MTDDELGDSQSLIVRVEATEVPSRVVIYADKPDRITMSSLVAP